MRSPPLETDVDVCPECYERRGWMTPLATPGSPFVWACHVCWHDWKTRAE
ncbi:MAG: hypothetical protein JO116_01665 [Planctomycetaceae bacterium]|nr:hypothetical protein [Planctomycetaceae bacterium]